VQLGMSALGQKRTCALHQPSVYLDCRRSPLILSVCDTSNSSKTNKKDRGFWEPLNASPVN
jgi:hypothetical protein